MSDVEEEDAESRARLPPREERLAGSLANDADGGEEDDDSVEDELNEEELMRRRRVAEDFARMMRSDDEEEEDEDQLLEAEEEEDTVMDMQAGEMDISPSSTEVAELLEEMRRENEKEEKGEEEERSAGERSEEDFGDELDDDDDDDDEEDDEEEDDFDLSETEFSEYNERDEAVGTQLGVWGNSLVMFSSIGIGLYVSSKILQVDFERFLGMVMLLGLGMLASRPSYNPRMSKTLEHGLSEAELETIRTFAMRRVDLSKATGAERDAYLGKLKRSSYGAGNSFDDEEEDARGQGRRSSFDAIFRVGSPSMDVIEEEDDEVSF